MLFDYICIYIFRFTSDKNTWSVDKQFLWGPAFMVSPAMQEVRTPTYYSRYCYINACFSITHTFKHTHSILSNHNLHTSII